VPLKPRPSAPSNPGETRHLAASKPVERAEAQSDFHSEVEIGRDPKETRDLTSVGPWSLLPENLHALLRQRAADQIPGLDRRMDGRSKHQIDPGEGVVAKRPAVSTTLGTERRIEPREVTGLQLPEPDRCNGVG